MGGGGGGGGECKFGITFLFAKFFFFYISKNCIKISIFLSTTINFLKFFFNLIFPMYHELGDTDSFSSNPPNNLELHDDHLPTSNKIEIHHTVSADDSLFGLALKYDQRLIYIEIFISLFIYSTQNIMSNNNMSSETIYPGQKLKILVNKSGSFIQNKEEIKKSIEKDPEDQAKIEEEIGIYIGFEEVFQNDVINPEFGLKGF